MACKHTPTMKVHAFLQFHSGCLSTGKGKLSAPHPYVVQHTTLHVWRTANATLCGREYVAAAKYPALRFNLMTLSVWDTLHVISVTVFTFVGWCCNSYKLNPSIASQKGLLVEKGNDVSISPESIKSSKSHESVRPTHETRAQRELDPTGLFFSPRQREKHHSQDINTTKRCPRTTVRSSTNTTKVDTDELEPLQKSAASWVERKV